MAHVGALVLRVAQGGRTPADSKVRETDMVLGHLRCHGISYARTPMIRQASRGTTKLSGVMGRQVHHHSAFISHPGFSIVKCLVAPCKPGQDILFPFSEGILAKT